MRTLKGPERSGGRRHPGRDVQHQGLVSTIWMARRRRRVPRLRSTRLCRTDYPDRVMAEYYLADICSIAAASKKLRRFSSECWPRSGGSTVRKSRATADTLASLAQVRIAQKNFGAAEKLIREALEAHQDSGSTAYRADRLSADDAGHGADATGAVRRRRAESCAIRSFSSVKNISRRSPIHRFRGALPGRGPARTAQVPRSGGRADSRRSNAGSARARRCGVPRDQRAHSAKH